MNQFLFLYPIKPYFQMCYELDKEIVHGLMNIIDARYRNEDFEINWVLFGKEGMAKEPDFSLVHKDVRIQERDRVISCGLAFWDHTKYAIYPRECKILDSIPATDRLVLGGFHQWDCVDRVAKASHERGRNTFVDEDTTEIGLFGLLTGKEIPLIRKELSLRNFLGDKIVDDEFYFKLALASRKDKPWFIQNVN